MSVRIPKFGGYSARQSLVLISLGLAWVTASSAMAQRAPTATRPKADASMVTTKPGAKHSDAFASPEAIGRWINGYRGKPEPNKLPELFHAMAGLGMFGDIDTAGLYLGFIGGMLAENPVKAQELVARIFPLSPEYQAALIKAVAYSGMNGWQDLLRSNAERMPARVVLIDRYTTGKMPALEGLKLDAGPVPLDVMWGNYYATGGYEPILRIISVLKWSKDENDVEKLTVGSMAKWTLASNAGRDAELLRLLKASLAQEPASVQKLLSEVILAAETGETSVIRREALLAIEQLKAKGPAKTRTTAWWGQAGQMALAFGCVAASAFGAPAAIGVPCVIGGAASTAALKLMTPN